MAKVLVTEGYLNNIAEAIRSKNGAATTYRPGDMAAAIQALDTSGIHPTGTKSIAANGTHDVAAYASANVNVQPNLQSKTATQNGTVTPDTGYDGLSSVVVNVSGGGSIVSRPVYINNNFYAGTVDTRSFTNFNAPDNCKWIFIIEITDYTGSVTFSDAGRFTVLYSDNSTGKTRMIVTNNGEWVDFNFTITLTASRYIRIRNICLANVSEITFGRANVQGTVSNRLCTISSTTSGFAVYVCFGNDTNVSLSTGDIEGEQWFSQSAWFMAVPSVVSGDAWPNSGVWMPATVFIKNSNSELTNVKLVTPSAYNNPNVCELLLTMVE